MSFVAWLDHSTNDERPMRELIRLVGPVGNPGRTRLR